MTNQPVYYIANAVESFESFIDSETGKKLILPKVGFYEGTQGDIENLYFDINKDGCIATINIGQTVQDCWVKTKLHVKQLFANEIVNTYNTVLAFYDNFNRKVFSFKFFYYSGSISNLKILDHVLFTNHLDNTDHPLSIDVNDLLAPNTFDIRYGYNDFQVYLNDTQIYTSSNFNISNIKKIVFGEQNGIGYQAFKYVAVSQEHLKEYEVGITYPSRVSVDFFDFIGPDIPGFEVYGEHNNELVAPYYLGFNDEDAISFFVLPNEKLDPKEYEISNTQFNIHAKATNAGQFTLNGIYTTGSNVIKNVTDKVNIDSYDYKYYRLMASEPYDIITPRNDKYFGIIIDKK